MNSKHYTILLTIAIHPAQPAIYTKTSHQLRSELTTPDAPAPTCRPGLQTISDAIQGPMVLITTEVRGSLHRGQALNDRWIRGSVTNERVNGWVTG